jgi:hypothetical protein
MKLRMIGILAAAACLSFLSLPARATNASGTVAVTATVGSSVSLTFVSDPSGITLGGTGTSAATIAFGNVQAYGGSVPSNVTKSVNGTTNWKLSTPFDVVVQVANQSSSNYTLTAQLNTADGVNTWQIGSTAVTSASAASLTTTGAYGTTVYTLNLTIPFSEAAGSISNTINFVATAN